MRCRSQVFRTRITKFPGGGILLLLMLVLAGCGGGEQAEKARETLVYTEVRPVPVTLTSRLPGRVSARVVSEVRPQVNGIIQKRLFAEGTDVAQGQPLYQIDPALYRAALKTARALLAETEARIEELAARKRRRENLVRAKAVSRQDLETAVSEYAQALAQRDKARAEVETAAINLDYTTIKAPVAGRIGPSRVTEGALVTANQAEPLAKIQQTGTVYVDISQSSAHILRLRRALASGGRRGGEAPVHLILEDGAPYTNADGSPVAGRLLLSDISVDRETGSVTLRALFPNPDGLLLPGMYVSALVGEGERPALLVPQRSVFLDSGGGHQVCVLRRDPQNAGEFFVEKRDVDIERAHGTHWIIRSGLEPGDLVVVEGLQKARAGNRVRGRVWDGAPQGTVWLREEER